jgi:hypothetical protein
MLRTIAFTLVGIAVLGVLLLLGSETLHMMPGHALVLVADGAKTYHGLPNQDICGDEHMRVTTAEEAKRLGYGPCDTCRNDGLFMGRTCSTIRSLAEDHLGFPRGLDRWNADGSWNW